ncbi:MAG: MerR family transcriptional regulator [Bacteroidia bacterium]|nr:MerR family transcriptional regulator [Bacteroidia bacterium]
MTKLYYSIGEVAEMFNVNVSHIRFWTNEFSSLKPTKNNKGNRLYTPDDIKKIRRIHDLVKVQGFTLKGAQAKLKEEKKENKNKEPLIKSLQKARKALLEIHYKLENSEKK